MAEASAAPGLSKKPHFRFPEKPPKIQQIPSKSHSNSISKTLVVLVIVLVIPLFPSQPPDFISQTIFSEFWEILRLLFIGIAVSYGVFARKTAQTDPSAKNSTNDDSDSYLSGISHLSHVFEDGFESIYRPDEQDTMQRNSDQFSLGRVRSVVRGDTKIRSLVSDNVDRNICDKNGENADREWRSQYLKGESLVVVSNGKYFLGGSSDYKPLNLPVRSLKSSKVVVENDKPQLNSTPENETKGKKDAVKVIKIRGVVPTNLQKKLDEAAGPSFIPWRSRSLRMENREEKEEMSDQNQPFSHCRPHSIGEFDFEHLESNNSKKYGSRCEDDEVGKGKRAIQSFDSDIKSDKALSRAKSVRTTKSSRYITMNKKEQFGRRIGGKFGDQEYEIPRFEREKREKREKDRVFFPMPKPKPKPTISEFDDDEEEQQEDIHEGNNVVESKNERESDSEKSSHEDDAIVAKVDNDAELEGSEVDRKAGEFIAKFREQIRLQKSSSVAEGG